MDCKNRCTANARWPSEISTEGGPGVSGCASSFPDGTPALLASSSCLNLFAPNFTWGKTHPGKIGEQAHSRGANVDNVIQLYALVKLQGKRAITCNLALATSKILNEAQAGAFWRYERSAWNVADWTTRADYFGRLLLPQRDARNPAKKVFALRPA